MGVPQGTLHPQQVLLHLGGTSPKLGTKDNRTKATSIHHLQVKHTHPKVKHSHPQVKHNHPQVKHKGFLRHLQVQQWDHQLGLCPPCLVGKSLILYRKWLCSNAYRLLPSSLN